MTDPLGSGVLEGAIDDVKGLVAGTYVPLLIGAILATAAIGIAIAWFTRGVNRFRSSGGEYRAVPGKGLVRIR